MPDPSPRAPFAHDLRRLSIASAATRARPRFDLEPVERRLLLATVSGAFFQDLDGDGVRDGNEGGLAGWQVYLDANQNGTFDGSVDTRNSTDTPKPLPDVSVTTSVLSVAGVGSFADVDVAINLTHTFNADLDVFLIAPGGQRVELFTDVGGSGDGMNVILDQEAAQSIANAPTGVITGTWRPEGNLATLYGTSADGNWTLEITDDANTDFGTLNAWSLTFGTGERRASSAPTTGAYQFSNVAAGTYDVRQVNQAGWNQTAPSTGFYTVQLGANSTAANLNFGNRQPPGTIRGTVWDDLDADGLREAGEPGLSGWTIYLDLNSSAQRDAGEPTVLSAADGAYEFANLAPGAYTVREILEPGYVQTAPGGGFMMRAGGAGTGGGDGPGDGVNLDTAGNPRKFTKTEVVVAFDGAGGKSRLTSAVSRDPRLAKWVNAAASADMMAVDGASLVEVKLRAGADVEKVVDALQQVVGVRWAQPNYVYDEFDPRELTPNDPQYTQQYHHTRMQNNLAWDTTLGSPSILVGVTDDGVLLNHPDLVDALWTNPNEIPGNGIDDDGNGRIDDVRGWDFWSNDNNANPQVADNDHGTHVAGIVGARTNNGVGVSGTAGGGGNIVPLKFYGTGGSWTSTIVSNTYRYAADLGLNIVTTSYNVDGFANDAIFAAGLEYMYDGGVLHFNSAGNNSQLNPVRQKFDQSLYVASTDAGDVKSSFSNYGWGIDIAAPGSDILATSIGSSLTTPNYEFKSGTSMSTPNAAAVAALIWSANPTWTREQVAAQLIATADNINAQNPSFVGLLGGGRVNSYRGVTQAAAAPRVRALAGLPAEGGDVITQPTAFTLDLANVFDPATMTLSSFELRGDGLDNVFGTTDDTFTPISVAFGTQPSADYKVGTNRLFFTVGGQMGSDRYRFSVLPTAADPFGQAIDGNGDGTGGDAFTRTFTLTGPTTPHTLTLNPGQVADGLDFGNHDVTPVRVEDAAFALETAQALTVRFGERVFESLGLDDLTLFNLTTGQPADTSAFTLAYDDATDTATFAVNGILADGNYVATFDADGITDASGNALDGNGDGLGGDDLVLSFFFLQGDANRDRAVNLADFGIVRANFGGTGKVFSQGDFNYDGTVNLADFGILRAQFGQTLPPPDGGNLFGGDGGGDDGDNGDGVI